MHRHRPGNISIIMYVIKLLSFPEIPGLTYFPVLAAIIIIHLVLEVQNVVKKRFFTRQQKTSFEMTSPNSVDRPGKFMTLVDPESDIFWAVAFL